MRPLVWLARIRHRRGYGIHSPSAFAFVMGVIYERGKYYAYEPLRRRYGLRCRRLRNARLLFRLANHVQPHTIIVPLHTAEAEQAHLQAGCMSARVVAAPLPADAILLCAAQRSMLIVPRLYEQRQLFEAIRQDKRVVVTYDLYDFGIALFDNTKIPQHYIINYETLY